MARKVAIVSRRQLTVVSHPCVVPVNQLVYAALQERGWDVSLVVPNRWRHEYSAVTVRPRALPELASRLSALPVLLAGRPQRHFYLTRPGSLLKARRPAALFCEAEAFSLAAFQWGSAAQRLGIPFGVQAAENLDRSLPAPAREIQRWVLRHAAFVFARSPAAARRVHRLGARGVVELVPHAVPAWPDVPRQRPNTFTVGFAGRLVPEKGVVDLLDAYAMMRSPARLLLVGDGVLRDTAALRPGVEVRTSCSHDDMPAAYAEMDALVLPSRTTPRWAEQFGRVLVEALWCGVPVVGSDSGEIPWVIESTGGGWVVPEGDVPQLAATLDRIARQPADRAQAATAGRGGVEAKFSLEAVATAMDGVLSAVAARLGARGTHRAD